MSCSQQQLLSIPSKQNYKITFIWYIDLLCIIYIKTPYSWHGGSPGMAVVWDERFCQEKTNRQHLSKLKGCCWHDRRFLGACPSHHVSQTQESRRQGIMPKESFQRFLVRLTHYCFPMVHTALLHCVFNTINNSYITGQCSSIPFLDIFMLVFQSAAYMKKLA